MFLVLALAAPVAAESTVTRTYPLPGGGNIQFQVPPSWRESTTAYEKGKMSTLTFWPPSGADFRVSLALHEPAPFRQRGPETEASRQRFMEEMLRQGELPKCEEKDLVSQKFSGAAGYGWYTSLTYKHIKVGERRPGPYRHVTLGTYLVDGELVTFMIESHAPAPQVIRQTLEMLKSARKPGP
jgi:hypothetical protein